MKNRVRWFLFINLYFLKFYSNLLTKVNSSEFKYSVSISKSQKAYLYGWIEIKIMKEIEKLGKRMLCTRKINLMLILMEPTLPSNIFVLIFRNNRYRPRSQASRRHLTSIKNAKLKIYNSQTKLRLHNKDREEQQGWRKKIYIQKNPKIQYRNWRLNLWIKK